MRVYVYEPPDPGYIEAEIAVNEYDWQGALEGRWLRSGIQALSGHAKSRMYLTREELLAEPGGMRALEAWQAGDDTPFQVGEEQWRRQRDEEIVRDKAAEGCTEAKAIIDAGLDPAQADQYINAHFCSPSCGGRYVARAANGTLVEVYDEAELDEINKVDAEA